MDVECDTFSEFPFNLQYLIKYSCMTADVKQIKKALRGVKVEVTHRGDVRRKYRISGLTSQPTRELMYDRIPGSSCLCLSNIVLLAVAF